VAAQSSTAVPAPSGSSVHELSSIIAQYGVWLVFANVFVEQVGIPVPALPTLIIAGALAAEGKLSLPAVFIAAFTAALIADWIWFRLGRRHGQRILKTWCKISLSPDACVRQTEGIFERWGVRSLVAAKFVSGFSTVAPALSGMMGVKRRTFLAYDALGVTLWAGTGVGLGFLFHDAVEDILVFLDGYGTGALVFLGGALALFILFKWWQRWRFYKALRMARISPEELHGLMDGDAEPVVVDVRTDTGRRGNPRRIPGALVLEISAMDAQITQLPRGREIVVYCT
jgi:membrane protein DedA with SNARE-associated domain